MGNYEIFEMDEFFEAPVLPRLCDVMERALGEVLVPETDGLPEAIGSLTLGFTDEDTTILQCGDGRLCERMCTVTTDIEGVFVQIDAAGVCLKTAGNANWYYKPSYYFTWHQHMLQFIGTICAWAKKKQKLPSKNHSPISSTTKKCCSCFANTPLLCEKGW